MSSMTLRVPQYFDFVINNTENVTSYQMADVGLGSLKKEKLEILFNTQAKVHSMRFFFKIKLK